MAASGLSERERAGCRDLLELLQTEELLALTDTVTNRLVHPESRQGARAAPVGGLRSGAGPCPELGGGSPGPAGLSGRAGARRARPGLRGRCLPGAFSCTAQRFWGSAAGAWGCWGPGKLRWRRAGSGSSARSGS